MDMQSKAVELKCSKHDTNHCYNIHDHYENTLHHYNVSIYNTGKSGGSFLQQILIGVFGSLQASTPYLGGILGLIIVAWIRAAQSLNKQFLAKNAEMEKKTWPLADFEKKEQ